MILAAMAHILVTETGSQALFMLSVVAISVAFALDDVATSQVGQAICSALTTLGFYLAWRKFPDVPVKHTIHNDGNKEATHPNRSILVLGFIQNWETLKKINQQYKHSLRWFLLGTALGEAAANAFISVAVVFLIDELGLSATEVGIFFLICLIFMPASTWLGEKVARRTNPSISWRLCMLYIFVVSLIGALTLNSDNAKPYSFLWGASVACGLGWFYHAENYYMSLVTPEDQANELAGFFNYCRLILVWLPPLLFSLLVEANVSLSYGLIVVACFFLLAIAVLSLSPSWEEVMKEVHGPKIEATEDSMGEVELEEEEETPQVLPTPVATSDLDC
jgi:MFS-type transporter involved in bile tolerance (Atg22 family)